jgi:protein-S-isoprenylcysteine O-methyltransferase Ste14
LYGEFDEGLENVSWGSCKAPLTVSLFLLFSIVLVLIIFVAFVTVHFVCSNNKETEMLIEADLAAQNEKYLERLGKLNPLPFKTQD